MPRRNAGTELCPSCRADLANHLEMLPDLYRRCEGILVGTRARGLERVHGGRPDGINLNDAAVAVRTEMMAVLASWAGLVTSRPEVRQVPERDIDALAGFLRSHLDWLARHAAAADLATEVAGLVRAAEDAISPHTEVRMDLGPCERPGCGHVVKIAVADDGDVAPSVVKCDGGHVWRPHQWLMLKHRIERAGSGSPAHADRV